MKSGSKFGYPPEGWLYKHGRRNKNKKKRWFVLTDDELQYYKKIQDRNPQGTIDLRKFNKVKTADSAKMKFELTSNFEQRVYRIQADTQDIYFAWVSAIQEKIKKLEATDHVEKDLEGEDENEPKFAVNAENKIHIFDLDVDEKFRLNAGVSSRFCSWRNENSLNALRPGLFSFRVKNDLYEQKEEQTVDLKRIDFRQVNKHKLTSTLVVPLNPKDENSSRFAIGYSNPEVPTPRPAIAVKIVEVKNNQDKIVCLLGKPDTPNARGASDCTDISWSQNRVLCASMDGCVYSYDVPINEDSQKVFSSKAIYDHKDCAMQSVNPAIWRTCLDYRNERFLSLISDTFYVWDLNRSAPLDSLRRRDSLYACSWSTHSQLSNNFVVGGANKVITMFDIRQLGSRKKKVWEARGHYGAIRDVAFNPLVPHWIASAGDDSCINVWDIRSDRNPVRKLQAHTNAVNTVSWSKSHCEMLLSGGVDRTLRLWNLRIQPHYVINTIDSCSSYDDKFSGGIVGCGWSSNHPFQFFGASSSGETVCATIKNDFLKPFVNYRFKSKVEVKSKRLDSTDGDAEEKTRTATMIEGERLISYQLYTRDFGSAFSKIAKLSHKYWNMERQEWAQSLLTLTSESAFDVHRDDPKKKNRSFHSLLDTLSRCIPPNYKTLHLTKVDDNFKSEKSRDYQEIHFLKLRVALLKCTEEGKYRDLLSMQNDIKDHIRQNKDSFDGATLEKLVKSILPYDHIKGIEFSLQIGSEAKAVGEFPRIFGGVARILLSPTIYGLELESDEKEKETPKYIEVEKERSETDSDSDLESQFSKIPSALISEIDDPTSRDIASQTRSVVSQDNVEYTDRHAAKKARKALENAFRNPKIVLTQLQMMLHIVKALDVGMNAIQEAKADDSSANSGESDQPMNFFNNFSVQIGPNPEMVRVLEGYFANIKSSAAKKVIKIYEDRRHQDTSLFPAILHVFYFLCLIQQNMHDKAFILMTKKYEDLRSYNFAATIHLIINKIAYPKFQHFLEERLKLSPNMQAAKYLKRLTSASLTILNILFNSPFLPEELKRNITILDEFRLKLENELTIYFHEKKGSADTSKTIKYMFAQIKQCEKGSKTPFHANSINAFKEMLEGFHQRKR